MEIDTTPNFWPNRPGEPVRGIVVHVTEGSYESARAWITNPASSASYHFIVKRDGTAVQFVDTDAAAWANGLVVTPTWPLLVPGRNPNLYTLSIAYAGVGSEGPTIQQAVTIAALIRQLATQYMLPIDNLHVIPHNSIHGGKTCPGQRCDMTALRWLASLPQ